MKFRCERDVLADALASARRAAATRSTGLQVLSGLRLELKGDQLAITGTDLELTIHVTKQVTAISEGAAVIPGALSSDIVRSFDPGAVEVEVSGDEVSISSGRSQFSVRTLPVDEYPKLPEPSGAGVVIAATERLGDALRQVVRAASTDESRPILTGVRLEPGEDGGLRMVATDSYRLALRDLPGTRLVVGDQRALVPAKALSELIRVLGNDTDVTVQLGDREVSFTAGDTRLTTRLIEGEYPNYRQLIPASYPNKLVVNREALLDAIKRVKLLASDSKNVRINLQRDQVLLSAVSQEWGQASDTLDASYDGAEFTVAFNPDYLASGVEALSGEEVSLETMDAMKPAVLRDPADPSYLYLLMPVRVS